MVIRKVTKREIKIQDDQRPCTLNDAEGSDRCALKNWHTLSEDILLDSVISQGEGQGEITGKANDSLNKGGSFRMSNRR